jgi:hypothetical protein
LVSPRGEKYAALRRSKDPFARALLETYRVWLGKNAANADRESTTLFDTVAVYLALLKEKDFCVMENLMIRVTDDGFTRIDPAGKTMDCAMEWKDLGGFEDFLVRRIGETAATGYSAMFSKVVSVPTAILTPAFRSFLKISSHSKYLRTFRSHSGPRLLNCSSRIMRMASVGTQSIFFSAILGMPSSGTASAYSKQPAALDRLSSLLILSARLLGGSQIENITSGVVH